MNPWPDFASTAAPLPPTPSIVPAGSSVGIVGESGCGKSVTALSILRLVQSPPGSIESGSIELEGKDLLSLSPAEMRAIRGNDISMVFQEPMTSLNPVYTVGAQIVEAIRLHQKTSRGAAWKRAVEMLQLVGIPSADTNARAYPHQLSGGMRQRVMIAMAIACQPKLLLKVVEPRLPTLVTEVRRARPSSPTWYVSWYDHISSLEVGLGAHI